MKITRAALALSVITVAGYSPAWFALGSAIAISICLVGVGVIGCAEDLRNE